MRICIPLMMIAITFSVAALSVPASPRAMQKINPYLKIFYPGGDRLKLKLEKSAIIAMLRDAEDPAQVVIAYGVWLGGGRARVRLAELYRAKKALGDDVDDEVMEGVDANFNDLLVAQKYNLTGSGEARTISFAEIERQAAVLDLIDVTGDEFARGSFGYFISGRGGLPKAVRDFFSESDSNKARPTADQLKVWERLQQLDVPRKAVRRASYSFVKKDIMAVLLNAEDPVQVFAGYGVRLSDGRARVRLAELYRAKKAVSRELDDEVMKGIDVNFNALLAQEYNLGNKEGVRKITVAEIERQAAVLNLIDVTGDEFAEVRFNKFISGRSDLPQAVRDFFSGAGRTPEQLVVWQRLQQLDVPWKAAYSFTKEDIMSVLRNADDPTQVFAGYGVQLGGRRARVRLAQLYRAKESLRGSLRNKVMEKIDVNFDALLAQEYKLTGRYEARTIPLVEIERQVAVLDILDVTGAEFDDAIFSGFISGSQGLPRAVGKFFSEVELTAEQLVVWKRLQQLDEERKAARE